mgnify:CR=1 FL=1
MHAPTNIQIIGREVAIAWNDGVETYYGFEALRAALAAAADVDAPGSRALSAATRLASGAVLAAMAGAAVVTAITFGARLLGALR